MVRDGVPRCDDRCATAACVGAGGAVMTRKLTVTITLVMLMGLAMFDLATSTLNPYAAPAAFALGSGQAAAGAHCAAMPE